LKDGYRQQAFVMTKIDARTKLAATRQIEESLRRLEVETIDLMQLHEVIHPEDPDLFFGPDGAIDALLEARKAGKIRYIGFTGHKDPAIHLRMLNTAFAHGFVFDAVQMPLNVMDYHYRSFGHNVLPVLLERGIGVLGMKPLGDHMIPRSGLISPIDCLHFAMNLPVSVVINGCQSLADLQQALEAVRTFRPLSQAEVDALVAKTAPVAMRGQYELYKTSHFHDGTYYHPEWLA
jgi:aryl-alcohol dehydrogenase-like predicted oxidoreductase